MIIAIGGYGVPSLEQLFAVRTDDEFSGSEWCGVAYMVPVEVTVGYSARQSIVWK